MSADRIADLDAQLRSAPPSRVRINRDFAPTAYFRAIEIWGMQFSTRFSAPFRAIEKVSFHSLLIAICILAIFAVGAFSRIRNQVSRTKVSAASVVFSMGLCVMTSEVLLMLGFQAVYGFVFEELAIIIAAFIGGMAFGSWFATRQISSSESRCRVQILRLFAALLVTVALMLFITPAIIALSELQIPAPILHTSVLMIGVLCGAAGGYQFPLALRLFVSQHTINNSIGVLYALDLLGASAGAIFVTAWLLPMFGFLPTAALIAVTSLTPLVFLLLCLMDGRPSSPSLHALRTR